MTVFFDISIPVDGFMAGPNASVENPMGDGGERLHDWIHRAGINPDDVVRSGQLR